jgi:hypothetical protein
MTTLIARSIVAGILVAFAMPRESVLVVSVGDAKTGSFISGAQVRIPSLGRIERTKWDGEARFDDLRPGRYRVQVRAIGYAPGDIDLEVKGDTASLHFELEKINPMLDTVRVTATRAERQLDEFETRRRQNLGRFITDSMLQAERAKSIQQLLVAHVPGLKIVGRGVKAMEPQTRKSGMRPRRTVGDGCPVLIFLDGFEFSDPEIDVANIENIRPEELAGVEAYTLNTVPVQYKRLGDYCKVLLLWTKP